MNDKSDLHQKIESSINRTKAEEKTRQQERLKRLEMSFQLFNDVSSEVRQLSREIARYKSGISFKMSSNIIHLNYKYGMPATLHRDSGSLYIEEYGNLNGVVEIHRFTDVKSTMNWIAEWCANHISYINSEKGQAIRRRAKLVLLLRTTIFTIIGLSLLLIIYLFFINS